MRKYKISATITQDLEVMVEANSYEEARAIAESNDLVSEDLECINQEFNIIAVEAVI